MFRALCLGQSVLTRKADRRWETRHCAGFLFEEGGSLYLASLDNTFDCCSLFLLFLNVVEVLVAQIRQR